MGETAYTIGHSDGMIGKIIDKMVSQAIDFNNSAVIVFSRLGSPYLMYDNFSDIAEAERLDSFLRHSHVLSPIYQCFITQKMPSVSTARELAPLALFHRDLPYLLSLHISFEPNAISDEIYISVSNETHCMCYFAIRTVTMPFFCDAEVQQVKGIAPKVQELLENFLGLVTFLPQNLEVSHTVGYADNLAASDRALTAPSKLISEGFSTMSIDEMFRKRLSRREQQTISMTLQGNSVDNIAYVLSISPHTVRVHMRNAYSKLRVRNRLELFAMFLKQAGFKGESQASSPDTNR